MKTYKFDPLKELNIDIPKSNRKEALEAAATYLKEAVLDYIGEGKSPVSGFGKFPGYTKEYKSEKGASSSSSAVNLELSGEMLDALSVKVTGSKLELGVFGGDELLGKAEGNNLGTYGQPNPIPGKVRRFIPLDGENLKRDILRNMKTILEEYGED